MGRGRGRGPGGKCGWFCQHFGRDQLDCQPPRSAFVGPAGLRAFDERPTALPRGAAPETGYIENRKVKRQFRSARLVAAQSFSIPVPDFHFLWPTECKGSPVL